jgi:hypothetical protein
MVGNHANAGAFMDEISDPFSGNEVWRGNGFVHIGDILQSAHWDAILDEALQFRDESLIRETHNIASHRDGSFASPSHFHYHGGGSRLVALLRSNEMLKILREATGMERLIPVRCAFNLYRRGDYIGVHRDSIKSTVTLSFSLSPELPPMLWAPEMRAVSSAKLAEFVQSEGHLPTGHATLGAEVRHMFAFDGYNIPHWRPRFEGEAGILGTLSYFEL